jgi:autotransporter adhesin
VALGTFSNSSGDSSAAMGYGSSSSGVKGVALGANSSAAADNSVALGAGSVADQADTVSVGNAGAGYKRRITNVAPGRDYSDAATVGQVQDMNTEGRHFSIQSSQSSGAVVVAAANAAAVASAIPGHDKVAIGAGTLGAQGGVGMAYQHSFGKWSATLTGATNGTADYSHVGGAVGFGW